MHAFPRFVLCLLLVFAGASAFAADAGTELTPPTFRLPDGARPIAYAITLTVVPGAARAAGDVAIDVELARPHAVLWLNAEALTVSRAVAESPGTTVKVLAGQDQFVGLAFDPPLPAGRHRVTVAFDAEQSTNSNRGIFTLQDAGAWYSMTQFEAISARRAFPCFDEPGFKTPWQLTLRVPRELVAVSNTAVESETPGDDGLKTVRFAPTRPLPSYLVAFAVGPWQTLNLGRFGAGRTPTRIVVPNGRQGDADFVAAAYPQLFAELEQWFGLRYPFDKLDHIAIPLTVNFAMENAALITYGAPNILAKQGAATARFRRSAANVGAHEIAHQWFGDLVTMAWWDDIWLNEAFATWMAEKIVDRWHPDYDRGAARVTSRSIAIDADSLATARRIREPVTTRGGIFSAFDGITYQKGATVIGMFEQWIGEAPFRRGVQRYLEAHGDGSATAADLLAALTEASQKPVAAAFDTFLNQNGVPQIDVRLQCSAGAATLALTQHRLATFGAASRPPQHWQVPVCARVGSGPTTRRVCTLMREPSETLALGSACPSFVFANAGGGGYYVPRYEDGLLDRVARSRSALSPAEFASLLDDLRALAGAGEITQATALQWVRHGAAARERHVVREAIGLAEFVGNTMVAPAAEPQFAAFVREVFGPRARAVSFAPKRGESDDDELMRQSLLRFTAPYDPALAREARRLALAWISDRKAVDPSLVDVVLVTAARTGDAAMLDALLAETRKTQDRLDRRNLMMALFAFTDPALAAKGMSILLDPSFDVRETWTALRNVNYWNPTRRATHDFVVANFDALAKTVGRDTPGGWVHYAEGLCSEEDATAVEAFWKPRAATYSDVDRALPAALESIRLCARLRGRPAS